MRRVWATPPLPGITVLQSRAQSRCERRWEHDAHLHGDPHAAWVDGRQIRRAGQSYGDGTLDPAAQYGALIYREKSPPMHAVFW